MKFSIQCAAALPLLLAACGGGDSGSPTPAPVVTPAPTPTPTAPVEPPAATFHTKIFDFTTASWTRYGPGVEMNTFKRYEPSGVPNYHLFDHQESELHTAGSTAEINYALPTEEISLKYRGYYTGFTKDQIVSSGDWFRYYSKRVPCNPTSVNDTCAYETLDVTQSMLFEYVAVGKYQRGGKRFDDTSDETMRYFVFGSDSVSSEMPTASTLTYEAGIVTSHPDYDKVGSSSGYQGTGSLTVNFAAGTLEATIPAKTVTSQGDLPFRDDTFKLTGTIASKIRMAGDIVNADGKYAGKFVGAFYGPSGSQLGVVLRLADASAPSRPHLIGFLVARRK
ncbi:HupA family protein [Novosphingobium soli]|uniref:Transferrin-binding protein B C-lobe/N-lobe beta barrel domain-containing protein n=1 Tax=Novosphingobium soli TaxID=574956 RepID=A0ABV6CUI5_9SPHN